MHFVMQCAQNVIAARAFGHAPPCSLSLFSVYPIIREDIKDKR